MGRKRKREISSVTARSRIPSAERKPPSDRRRWVTAGVCIILSLLTWVAFQVVSSKDFSYVNLDDNRYVYNNAHVVQGLTKESIEWAFTSLEYDNWHPLTWLSHMLDSQMFGPEGLQHPWAYHRTNLLLHTANVVVLFLALRQMTSALWPSMLVAVLFAVHPMRAESVAWISERKDVLSGLFFMLTLWAYGRYATREWSWPRYLLVVTFYGLGLMAKPMLVSLPVLLLLLDYWPLRRPPYSPLPYSGKGPGARAIRSGQLSIAPRRGMAAILLSRAIIEKAPLFLLALASCSITMFAQRGAMLVIDNISFSMRLTNSVAAYASYVGMLFWPANLAPMYPFPEHGIAWLKVTISLAVLVGVSALAIRQRRCGWLAVGWLWFLISIFPVIGLVQVGVQSMADRYTYLPHIGLYIVLAWGLETWMARWPQRRWTWAAAVAVAIPLFALKTSVQTATWKNNDTFWTAALASNPDIAVAHNNLGYIRQEQGRMDEAFEHFCRAVEIRPRYVEGHINLGNVLTFKGQLEEGLKHYRTAIEIRPDFDQSYVNLGTGLMLRGDFPEAEKNFRIALKINPEYTEAGMKLGTVLGRQQKFEEAIACYEAMLKFPGVRGDAAHSLGYLYFVTKRPIKALENWKLAIDVEPNSILALTMTAWLLSTDPDPVIRNPTEAIRLSNRAIEQSNRGYPHPFVALAAAQAEAGDFPAALQSLERARELGAKQANTERIIGLAGNLETFYRAGKICYNRDSLLLITPDELHVRGK